MSTKNVWVVTKNGNLVEVVGTQKTAEKHLRNLLATELKIKCPNAKAVVKKGILEIEGTPHYRAKLASVQ